MRAVDISDGVFFFCFALRAKPSIKKNEHADWRRNAFFTLSAKKSPLHALPLTIQLMIALGVALHSPQTRTKTETVKKRKNAENK